MFYFGLDPSANSTGFALLGERNAIERVGVVQPKRLSGAARLAYLRDKVHTVLCNVEVVRACIEAPAYDAPMQADLLGQVRGVFLLLLHDLKIPTLLVAPSAVKKYATRKGSADKQDVIKAARQQWPTWQGLGKADDEADALWLASVARGCSFPDALTRAQLEVVHQLKQLRK